MDCVCICSVQEMEASHGTAVEVNKDPALSERVYFFQRKIWR